MKINKFSVIAGVALSSLVLSADVSTAQDQKGGQKRGPSIEQRMERMNEELKLTDEQKPKVKAVLEDSQKKRQEMRTEGGGGTPEERREKARSIMDNESKKLKEILTADQYTKYEKMREEMRGAAKGKARKKGPDGQEKKD